MNPKLTMAADAFEALCENLEGEETKVASVLARAGRFPAAIIAANPTWLTEISSTASENFGAERIKTMIDECENITAVNTLRYKLTLRSFYRELIGESVRNTMREFSILAAGIVEWVLQRTASELEFDASTFGVLGLGKLGGFELNYGSDIDLIFYAESVNERTAEFARSVVEMLSHRDENGFLFRVDLRLRPDGSQGPIVQSVDAMRRYYLQWGRTWERGAMMKARPIAGNVELGNTFLTKIEPFLYRKHLDFDSIEALRSMRDAIQEHAKQLERKGTQETNSPSSSLQTRLHRRMGVRKPATSRKTREGWDIKIGTGGIREIEFFVQALQLVHSGRSVQLRTASTLEGLARLVAAGVISDSEQREITTAYTLFRRVEHVVQLADNLQTHLLPEGAEKTEIAHRLGYEIADFESQIAAARDSVAAMFERLFSDEEKSGEKPTVDSVANPTALLSAVETDTDIEQVFKRFGFQDPRSSASQLRAMQHLRYGPFSEPSKFSRFVLSSVVGSPDPDLAMGQLLRFVSAVGDRPGFFNMLAKNPHTTQLLIHLLGGARTLAHALIQDPNVFGRLLSVSSVAVDRDPAEVEETLRGRLADITDPDHRFGIVRRFQQEEFLRIGLHLSGEAIETESAFEQLSNLADVVLTQVLDDVFQPLRSQKKSTILPELERLPFIVVALGKHGGRELGFGSDLDLMFVYEDDRQYRLSHTFFSKITQRFVRALSGPSASGRLYAVDTRLRPSGNKGALVVSLTALRDYHKDLGRTWERQALLRARVVFGNPALRSEFELLREQLCRASNDIDALKSEVSGMRSRIDSTFGSAKQDLKFSAGGLVDCEFSVQYLQLIGQAPLTQNTATAIRENTFLDAERTSVWVKDYLWLRRLEALLRIGEMSENSSIPESTRGRNVFARRAGFAGDDASAQLEQSIGSTMARNAELRKLILD